MAREHPPLPDGVRHRVRSKLSPEKSHTEVVVEFQKDSETKQYIFHSPHDGKGKIVTGNIFGRIIGPTLWHNARKIAGDHLNKITGTVPAGR